MEINKINIYTRQLNIQISDGHYGDVDHHPDGVFYWAVLTGLQSSIGNDNDVGILSPIALKKIINKIKKTAFD